ncbi:BQ5605_C008g05118 [Microbotryum silenes-dioicae]|uniref:BQ5605_C008g05118 protein n=1 Tax=Microbotryum silenes-dioicae TaxID=796604 RepID=A0A2X0PEC4_9BASI|nr:BQ5605_C008g05118 [Microbotryum silenes-dioicae]
MARGKRNKRNPKAHAPPPISEREARLQSRRTRLQVLDHLPRAAPSPPAFSATSPSAQTHILETNSIIYRKSNLDDEYEDLEPPGSSQQGLSDISVDATHSRSPVRLQSSINEVDLSPGSDKRLHEPHTRPRVVDYSLLRSASSMTLFQEDNPKSLEAPVFPEPRTFGATIDRGTVASSPDGWTGSISVEVRDDAFDHAHARTESRMSEVEPERTARVRHSPSSHRFSVASSICSSEGSSTHDSYGLLGYKTSSPNMEGHRAFNAQLRYQLAQSSALPSEIALGKVDLNFNDVISSVTERLSPRVLRSIVMGSTIWPSPSQFQPTTCGVTAYDYNGDLFLSLRDVFTGSRNMCLWKGTSPPDDVCGRYSRGTFSLSGSQNIIFETDVFSQLESASPADTTLLSSAQFIRLAKGAAASDPPQLWIQMFSTEAQRREVLGALLSITVDPPPICHSRDPVVLRASATDPKRRGALITTTCPPQTDVLEPGSCPKSTPVVGANDPAPHAAKAQDHTDNPATLPFCLRLDASGPPLLDSFFSGLKPEESRNVYVPNGTWTIPIRVERHGLNTSPIIQPIFSYSKQSGSRYRKRPHHIKYPHLSKKVKAIKSKCLGVYVCANSGCFGIGRPMGTLSVGSRSNTVSAQDGPKRHTHSTCTAHSLRRECDICHAPLMHKTCEAYTLMAQLDDSDLTAAELADPNFETCGMSATIVIVRHRPMSPTPMLRELMRQPCIIAQAFIPLCRWRTCSEARPIRRSVSCSGWILELNDRFDE